MNRPKTITITDPDELAKYEPRVGDLVTERVKDTGSETDNGYFDGQIVRVEREVPAVEAGALGAGSLTVGSQSGQRVRIFRLTGLETVLDGTVEMVWCDFDGNRYGEDEVTDFVPDEAPALPTRDDLARIMHDDYLPNGAPRLGRNAREELAAAVLRFLRGEVK